MRFAGVADAILKFSYPIRRKTRQINTSKFRE